MITVSYNIISLNEVRKISDNNNRGEHCFPIVVGHNILVQNKNQMDEFLNFNIERNHMHFVIKVLRELGFGHVSKDIVNKAIANLTKPDQLEMAIYLANRYNIKETKDV